MLLGLGMVDSDCWGCDWDLDSASGAGEDRGDSTRKSLALQPAAAGLQAQPRPEERGGTRRRDEGAGEEYAHAYSLFLRLQRKRLGRPRPLYVGERDAEPPSK